MIKKIYRKLQTLFVPPSIKKNFIYISEDKKDILRKEIKNSYIPTISKRYQTKNY